MLESKLKSLKEFFDKYERRIGLAFLIGGFIFDNLTLRRVDFLLDNLVLLSYLAIVALSIIAIDLKMEKVSYAAPYAMQFAIGGLFSGFIVFYFRSAALTISWPFLLMLAAFFIGNEFFRRHYALLAFRMAIFFIAVFSYLIFSLPVVLHRIGADIFILSGAIGLLIVMGLMYFIKKKNSEHAAGHYPLLIATIGAIYLIFNIFYFTNIIPPIPLALKEAGIYHRVERLPGGYLILGEKRPWYSIFSRNKIYLMPGESAYAYSSVFAPTRLETNIFHRWSFYNEQGGKWIETNRIGFPIVGGRDKGYRGYSIKENIFPGRWRVDVITERGQVIGRMNFRVIETETLPELEYLENYAQ